MRTYLFALSAARRCGVRGFFEDTRLRACVLVHPCPGVPAYLPACLFVCAMVHGVWVGGSGLGIIDNSAKIALGAQFVRVYSSDASIEDDWTTRRPSRSLAHWLTGS